MNLTVAPTLENLAGTSLGTFSRSYSSSDAILYALSVGAAADELDLVYERELRTLPSYACALGLWAVEAAGRLGAYDPKRSLHAAQYLTMHQPLPPAGTIEMTGSVTEVIDKTKASIVKIEVSCDFFTASYDIFLPGVGGFGGPNPGSVAPTPVPEPNHSTLISTSANLAALYRLTGDRHPIHIDPEVAALNGFERPILHGLCTLGIAAREIAGQVGAHPADLKSLSVKLSAPVLPGQSIEVSSSVQDGTVHFSCNADGAKVIKAGTATFG